MYSCKVSIIIVNYNTFELTCQCIQSIIDKTAGVSYEIILVDNASLECDPLLFKERFPTIQLIASKENLGFAKGNNLGIEQAKGEFIVLLNSDAELHNNALEITSKYLEENKQVGVVSASLQYPNGELQHCCQRFPSIQYQLIELLRLHKFLPANQVGQLLLNGFFDHQVFAQPDWVWGTYFMFPQHLLKELPKGRLADNFFMYIEDMQWCFEIRQLGYEIHYLPNAQVIHHMGGSAGKKNKWMEENYETFLRMYYPHWKIKAIKVLQKCLSF